MELSVDQALRQGVAAQKAGKLKDAERLYRAILQVQPKHPEANHNLGVMAVAVGKALEAIPRFKLALEVNPKIEQFWLSYIDALIKVERFDEAKRMLVEGEKSGVSSERLKLFHQQIQTWPSDDKQNSRQGSKVSETRERLAEKKKSEKRRPQTTSPSAGPSQDQINRLLELYQYGKFADAKKLAASLTQQSPSHPFAWKVMGAVLKQTGRLNESLLPVQKSVELSPNDAEAHYNLGNTLTELGKLDEAEASYKQAIALKPDYAHTHYNLGNTLKELGKLDEAEASYKKTIALTPDYAEAYSNLGVALQELGKLDEAEASCRQAIAIKPDYAHAHYNLGNTLKELGKLDEAEASYKQAIAMKPDYAEAYINLGVMLQELGRLGDAEASYKEAITLEPDYAEAHSNLGNTLRGLGRSQEAEASFRQAIALKPDFAEAHINLCDLLQATNKIDKLLLALGEARSKIFGIKADFLYFEALVYFRTERYAEAGALLDQITEGELSETSKASYYKLVGDFRHRNRDYDAAFSAYEDSNRTVKAGREFLGLEIAAGQYFELHKNTALQLEQLSMESPLFKRPYQDGRGPSFLVGFPRSGTTLLDTILRTHSRITVIEEQPMVQKVSETLGGLRDVSAAETVDSDRLSVARESYLKELSRHTLVPEESLVIDKFPLNLLRAPLISQAFPEAKFILALRHPLDCILSCWMQNFRLNAAMANMVDLDRIVDFYCVAMKIFKLSQERYGLNVHRIRYEDLIEDFETASTSVLEFLGLEWEIALLNYQATALARPKINTPSHSQVIKPIYKTASYRWKHYEKHLEKYKSQLSLWIEEYGY